MGPEGIILANPPIITFQQSLTHSAMVEKPSRAVSSSGWTGQGRLQRSCCLFKIRTRVFGLLVIQIYFNVIGHKYCDGLSFSPLSKIFVFFWHNNINRLLDKL